MEEKERGYLTGIIGALIGGLIATIPWILCYVYANMIYSLLAIIVAIASLKGYELFKGKIDKKLPIIIAITSLLSITIATLIIIPNLLILKEFGTMSLANFKLIYETSETATALLSDYAISVLFTILGIGGVISTIKAQVDNGSKKIDLNYDPTKISDEEREKIRNIFVKYNALSKESAISKEVLLRETEEESITYLTRQGYVKTYKGNYYFSEKALTNRKRNLILCIVIPITIVLFLAAIGILSADNNNTNNNNNSSNSSASSKEDNKNEIKENREVSYTIPNDYQEFENDSNGWYYVPKKDLSGDSGAIDVSFDTNSVDFGDYDELKESLKVTFEEDDYKIKEMDDFNNTKGNKVIFFVIEFDDYEEIIYYIFNGKKYAIIDGFNSYSANNSTIRSAMKEIVQNFDWNE